MKILFVSPGHPIYDSYPDKMGGTQYQIYGMSKELAKLGHEVYVLRRYNGIESEIIDGVHFIGIKTHFNDEIISVLIFSWNAADKIKEITPDVINLSERFSAYFPSKLDIPKIFFTGNYDAFKFYKKFAVEYNKLNYLFFDMKRGVEEGIMRKSGAVIALNKSIDEYIHSRGITHTKVVSRGVEAGLYKNVGDEGYILFAGRLNKVKRVEYLIKAFDLLGKDFDGYLLILVGSGPDEKRLREIASFTRKKEKIKFVPWVDKPRLREYLSRCSVFVLPSLFEVGAGIILEAMASGKAVVASNIIGPKDIITPGQDGFLFEKGNMDDLKEKLELLLDNAKLRNDIGNNARKKMDRHYTFEKVSKNLEELYKKRI